MSVLPIDPSTFGASPIASEWQVAGVAPPAEATQAVEGVGGSESFGDVLAEQISNLSDLQARAAEASTALANGTATDASSVVIAVEKAQLAMQLAGQIRTRAAEAINDIFHTQV